MCTPIVDKTDDVDVVEDVSATMLLLVQSILYDRCCRQPHHGTDVNDVVRIRILHLD